jgi:hypothetical protein
LSVAALRLLVAIVTDAITADISISGFTRALWEVFPYGE